MSFHFAFPGILRLPGRYFAYAVIILGLVIIGIPVFCYLLLIIGLIVRGLVTGDWYAPC